MLVVRSLSFACTTLRSPLRALAGGPRMRAKRRACKSVNRGSPLGALLIVSVDRDPLSGLTQLGAFCSGPPPSLFFQAPIKNQSHYFFSWHNHLEKEQGNDDVGDASKKGYPVCQARCVVVAGGEDGSLPDPPGDGESLWKSPWGTGGVLQEFKLRRIS